MSLACKAIALGQRRGAGRTTVRSAESRRRAARATEGAGITRDPGDRLENSLDRQRQQTRGYCAAAGARLAPRQCLGARRCRVGGRRCVGLVIATPPRPGCSPARGPPRLTGCEAARAKKHIRAVRRSARHALPHIAGSKPARQGWLPVQLQLGFPGSRVW